jgi:triacylglycerol lipase
MRLRGPFSIAPNNMTNARIQRWLVLGSFALWWSLAAGFWPERPWLATGCALMPFLITPILLLYQCFLAARANRQDEVPQAGLGAWLNVALAEWAVATRVFSYWQPFRHHAIADRLSGVAGQRGVVLVHGFFCNRALWTPWMQALHAQERVFVAVDLEPAFGSISTYADQVEQAIAQVEQATGLAPVLVGHSMGGLAIRAWAQKYALAPDALKRIHHVFTLGTPHHGTQIAEMSHTQNGQEMRRGSTWLAANLSALPDAFSKNCTCFYSNCDNIVFPSTTALLPEADNRLVMGRGHVELAFVPEVMRACLGK